MAASQIVQRTCTDNSLRRVRIKSIQKGVRIQCMTQCLINQYTVPSYVTLLTMVVLSMFDECTSTSYQNELLLFQYFKEKVQCCVSTSVCIFRKSEQVNTMWLTVVVSRGGRSKGVQEVETILFLLFTMIMLQKKIIPMKSVHIAFEPTNSSFGMY